MIVNDVNEIKVKICEDLVFEGEKRVELYFYFLMS